MPEDAPAANQELLWPGDELVTLDDGRVYPLKKTICLPRGNKVKPAGPRVKCTAKLREEAETDEWLLRKAAQDGSLENLRNQINRGTDVNNRAGQGGATPLVCAAVGGYLDVSRELVAAGADPELANGHFNTPLMIAAQWNHINLVRFYLEECKMDPRQWNNAPAPMSPIDQAKQVQNDDMVELIAKYWMKFQEKDDKKAEKQKKADALKVQKYKEKVSRESQARRPAVAVS